MNQRKKKAFTLTELLVVVVIIGVLAAVVLPKFNKVIETRKTTEAEEIMAAVRTEQERRCALDKPYIGNINKLVTAEVLPQKSSKNYTYSLEETGMLASSKGMSYELKMPSYADGRVCCEGADCGKLNKDYPTCNDLVQQSDYQQATACTAEIPSVPEPESETDPETDPESETEPVYLECETDPILQRPCTAENTCGFETRTILGCDHSVGNYEYSNWNSNDCQAIPEAKKVSCDNGCESYQVTYTCESGNLVSSDKQKSDCVKTAEECEPKCLTNVVGCQELDVTVDRQIPFCSPWGPGNGCSCGSSYRFTDITNEELESIHRQVRQQILEGGMMKLVPADCEPGRVCACEPGVLYTSEVGLNAYQGTNGGCSFYLELPDDFPSLERGDDCRTAPWSTPRHATWIAKPEVPYYQCVPLKDGACTAPSITCNVRQTCERIFGR